MSNQESSELAGPQSGAGKHGTPRAVRAVAGACAANRLAVVIPRHRALAKDGRISGYRWGVERKKQLLENEKKPRER